MKNPFPLPASFAVLLFAAGQATAQGLPPPPPDYGGPDVQERRRLLQDLSPEQRERMRAERRERHAAWQRMSPEERQQLRRDIRDSGQTLYPYGRRQRPD